MPIAITNAGRTILINERHAPYRGDIESHFDVYFNAVEDENGVVDFSRGKLHRYRDTGLEFMLAAFPEEPFAVRQYTEFYRPKRDEVVFDLGAYCGVSAVEFAKTAGLVVAVEPDPDNRQCLIENLLRHHAENVVVGRFAVDTTRGKRQFYADGNLGSSLTGYFERNRKPIEVETVTLEDMVAKYGVPALVKMDIEGAEVDVLDSSRALLKDLPLRFVIDSGHVIRGEVTRRPVEQILRDCGYQAWSAIVDGNFSTTWAQPQNA